MTDIIQTYRLTSGVRADFCFDTDGSFLGMLYVSSRKLSEDDIEELYAHTRDASDYGFDRSLMEDPDDGYERASGCDDDGHGRFAD